MFPSIGKPRLKDDWLLRRFYLKSQPEPRLLLYLAHLFPSTPTPNSSPCANPVLNLALTISAWENPLNLDEWYGSPLPYNSWYFLLTQAKNLSSPKGIQHYCSLPMVLTISASLLKAAALSPGAQSGPRWREGPNVPIYYHCPFSHTSLDDLTCSDSRSKSKNSASAPRLRLTTVSPAFHELAVGPFLLPRGFVQALYKPSFHKFGA